MTLISSALNLENDDGLAVADTSDLAPHFDAAHRRDGTTSSSQSAGSDGPALARALIADAIATRASDLHVDPAKESYRIRLRIDGVLLQIAVVDKTDGQKLVNQFRVMSRIDPTETPVAEGRWTGVINDGSVDLRTTFISTIAGDKMAARLMAREEDLHHLSQLGLLDSQYRQLTDWLSCCVGLSVVTGPTGSGKTALLYALARQLDSPRRNMVSLEDPVERRIENMTQIEVDSKSGLDFAAGVKTALRLDPDFLIIGETRDQATARPLLAASTSGCGLLTSIHGDDATSLVGHLRYWGLSDREIAATLRFVISTRLVRKLCDHCSTTGELNEIDRRWLESHEQPIPDAVSQPVGCERCYQTGYLGRIGIYSLWSVTSDEAGKIREGANAAQFANPSPSLIEVAMKKVADGTTSISELRRCGMPRLR